MVLAGELQEKEDRNQFLFLISSYQPPTSSTLWPYLLNIVFNLMVILIEISSPTPTFAGFMAPRTWDITAEMGLWVPPWPPSVLLSLLQIEAPVFFAAEAQGGQSFFQGTAFKQRGRGGGLLERKLGPLPGD